FIQDKIFLKLMGIQNFSTMAVRNAQLMKGLHPLFSKSVDLQHTTTASSSATPNVSENSEEIKNYFLSLDANIHNLSHPCFLLFPLAYDGITLDGNFLFNCYRLRNYAKSGKHKMEEEFESPSLMQLNDRKEFQSMIQRLPLFEDPWNRFFTADFSIETLYDKVELINTSKEMKEDVDMLIFQHLLSRGNELPLLRMDHEIRKPYRYFKLESFEKKSVQESFIDFEGFPKRSLDEFYKQVFNRECEKGNVDENGKNNGNCFVVIGKPFLQGTRKSFLAGSSKLERWFLPKHAPQFVHLLPLTEPMCKQIGEIAVTIHEIEIQEKHAEFLDNIKTILSKMTARDANDLNAIFSSDWHNQRLEFLGDSILKFVISLWLFWIFKNQLEGELSTHRGHIVSNTFLRRSFRRHKVQAYVHARGFERSGDTLMDLRGQLISHKMQADIMEALLAAIYLTGRVTPLSDEICTSETFNPLRRTDGTTRASLVFSLLRAALFCDKFLLSDKTLLVSEGEFNPFLSKDFLTAEEVMLSIIEKGKENKSSLLHGFEKDYPTRYVWFQDLQFGENLTLENSHKETLVKSILSTSRFLLYAWLYPYYQLINPKHEHDILFSVVRNRSSDLPFERYERMEFLGDAILSHLITEWLYSSFPACREGVLSEIRGILQSNNYLARKFCRKIMAVDPKIYACNFILNNLGSACFHLAAQNEGMNHLRHFQDGLSASASDDFDDTAATFIKKSKGDATIIKEKTVESAQIGENVPQKALSDIYEAALAGLFFRLDLDLGTVWEVIKRDIICSKPAIEKHIAAWISSRAAKSSPP
ncbi:ribonuclease type III Dicer, partial [Cardiosporidium cionae]